MRKTTRPVDISAATAVAHIVGFMHDANLRELRSTLQGVAASQKAPVDDPINQTIALIETEYHNWTGRQL